MTRLTLFKLVLAALGIFVWFYGFQADNPQVRWAGIALLVVAVLLRFMREPPAVGK